MKISQQIKLGSPAKRTLACDLLFVMQRCTILLWPWTLEFGDGHYSNGYSSTPVTEKLRSKDLLCVWAPSFMIVSKFIIMNYFFTDPVASWSVTWTLSTRILKRGFESRLGHGCLFLVSLCCVVLCRYRHCEELITRSKVLPYVVKLIIKPLGWGLLMILSYIWLR
jgi:hypothetical protein